MKFLKQINLENFDKFLTRADVHPNGNNGNCRSSTARNLQFQN